jgi:hypothetical protein
VLALGPWLRVGGVDTHIPLPDIALAHVPILQDALPQRFTLYLWIATGVVVARWLGGSTRTSARPLLAFVLVATTLLPNVFAPGLHEFASVPPYFADGLWHDTVAPGETVLILHGEKGQEMLWQAATWMGFSMAQGHSGPEPASFRGDPIWGAIRDDLPGELDPDAFLAWLHEHDVLAVIADPGSAARWATELSVTLGNTPVRVGGVEVYRVPDHSLKRYQLVRRTDSACWSVVIGSACRWTSLQRPSSRRKIDVTRRSTGATSSRPPTLDLRRSTSTMHARSGVTYLDISSKPLASPSR